MNALPVSFPNKPEHFANKCFNPNCDRLKDATQRCARCRSAIYCGVSCQKAHWPTHKTVCLLRKDPAKDANDLKLDTNLESDAKIDDFSERDLAILGYLKVEISAINQKFQARWGKILSKQTLSCFDYTLLAVGDRAVRENLFTPIGKRSCKKVMEERLSRWGYEVTQSPAEGDLVLYFKEDLTHMGLYLKNGLVKSKFGNEVSQATIHPVAKACERYGQRVIYYHKNPQLKPTYKEENVIKIVYK